MAKIGGYDGKGFEGRTTTAGKALKPRYRRGGRFTGSGFNIVFETTDTKFDRLNPFEKLRHDAIEIRSASQDAVVTTIDGIKNRIRDYITAHFTGSEMHGNNQRRVANASAQAKFYDDVEQKGQFAGLVYSKFGRGIGPAGFVDFLLLHVRGGTVKPKSGKWLRIPNMEFSGPRNTGYFPQSAKDVFFARSSDGRKLFMLRKLRRNGRNNTRGGELLATLVPSLAFPARLSGIDEILRAGGENLQTNLSRALTERGVGE